MLKSTILFQIRTSCACGTSPSTFRTYKKLLKLKVLTLKIMDYPKILIIKPISVINIVRLLNVVY